MRHRLTFYPAKLFLGLALSCANRTALSKHLGYPVSLPSEAQDAKNRNDWLEARAVYQRLVDVEPDNDDHWLGLGISLLNSGQPREAQNALLHSINLKDTPKAEYNLAIAFENTDEHPKAIEHLQLAVTLSPNYGLAWRRLALAQVRVGDWREAEKSVLRAKELRPDDVSVNELMGGIGRMLRTSRWPADALRRFGAGREAARKGDFKAAVTEYRAVLEKNPAFAECRAKMADALRRLGDLEQAEAEYRSALGGFKKIELLEAADSENNLANVLVEQSVRTEEAEALVRHAISVRGERPAYLDTLGRTCDLQQKLLCAKEAYLKLIENRAGVSKGDWEHAKIRLAEIASR